MKTAFTAIIEVAPEAPGVNGQGETIEETKNSLRQAIELILECLKEDMLHSVR